MTESKDVKKGRGTGWIIAAAAVYAWGLGILVRPVGTDEFGYKLFAVVFCAVVGTVLLLRGLRKRR
ncbi:D-alanyl-D-alanine carboxypeptidase [Leifsonia xyli subsp. cynodontis DSM 46306]|uniref:Uncharacterized protein n=1 Tax=Leifsonia xyli subsp. cynodontis DSM 46306 TaxID=1389489 RepID=U3PBY7_LEIXC|nr:hypothetical protein [Leifsonia xyli]AGW41744.1 D-alanyl-D-alanine carboxypeptidase [Leifsonia xyli subsp. cynodontis DSM 46306]AGW42267.1 D-alanyl-D-alanine carboxypeptidase [Leifsonia xyli subsp. cynodontis DSM 46306]